MITRIEQTQHFCDTVTHMAHLIDAHRYSTGSAEIFADFLSRVAKLRGKDYATKAAKKSNQKAHGKFFLWEAL